MTRALAAVDRLAVAVVGVLLVIVGALPALLHWNVPVLSRWATSVDRAQVGRLANQPWFDPALAGVATLLAIAGLALILANIRNRAFNNATVEQEDGAEGTIVLNVQRLADASCDHLALSPLVERAQASVATVGTRPTATFKVVARPEASLPEVASLIETSDLDFASACPGIDLDTVYKLELDRIN